MFKLLLVSLAMKVTLYWSIKLGIVNELLYLSVAPCCAKLSWVTVPLGIVMFAKIVSTPELSVTLAPISIVVKALYVVLATGLKSNTAGGIVSIPNNQVSCDEALAAFVQLTLQFWFNPSLKPVTVKLVGVSSKVVPLVWFNMSLINNEQLKLL